MPKEMIRKQKNQFQNQSKSQSLMEMVPGELPRATPLSMVKETEHQHENLNKNK
tara:strand:- start:184 stop:345 length:162 start_codon:yes stop_codon:yes gene_type:complete